MNVSHRVIRQTCSTGLKSGEQGGSFTEATLSRVSEYSGSISVSTRRIVFMCQDALSSTIANFFLSGAGFNASNYNA